MILLILSILFVLCSCGEQTAQAPSATEATEATEPILLPPVLTGDEDTFSLSYLPDIGDYQPEAAPRRWYADYVGELIPSDEYGELIPYLGYEKKYVYEAYEEINVDYEQFYGLCTADGVIVTDPAYISITEGEKGFYLLQSKRIYEDGRFYHKFYVAAKDGSSFVELDDCANVCYYVGNGIYCSREAYESVDGLQFFNRDGTLLWEIDYTDINDIPDLEGSADDVVIMREEKAGLSYFVDGYMRCTSAFFKEISFATNDRYIVRDFYSEKYGIIDLDGEYILPSEYDYIDYCEGRYLLYKENEISITDEDFSVISTLEGKVEPGDRLLGPYIIRLGYRNNIDIWGEPRPKEMYYRGVYSYEEDSALCLLDDSFSPIGQVPGGAYVVSVSDDKRYICLWISADDAEQEFGYYLYDTETGKLSECLEHVGDKHYGKKTEDGSYALYSLGGEYLHDYNGEFVSLDISGGEFYYYANGDYAYTEDSEGNIIVKRRAVFD